MLWPGNSPDLNTIEKVWFWIKKETTRRGPISNRKKLRARWEKYWTDLPQSKIQEWITVIPDYIQEIIRLEGGNKYKEGRKKGQEKVAIY
jgi:transposase